MICPESAELVQRRMLRAGSLCWKRRKTDNWDWCVSAICDTV